MKHWPAWVPLLALVVVGAGLALGEGHDGGEVQGAVHLVIFAAFLFLSLVP